MEIKCSKCQRYFQPDSKEEKRIEEAVKKGQRLVMTGCTLCGRSVPVTLAGDAEEEKPVKCPICNDGLVSYVDDGDEKFRGCGECGRVWSTKEELDRPSSGAF